MATREVDVEDGYIAVAAGSNQVVQNSHASMSLFAIVAPTATPPDDADRGWLVRPLGEYLAKMTASESLYLRRVSDSWPDDPHIAMVEDD